MLDLLGAAMAETGDFARAAETAKQATAIARGATTRLDMLRCGGSGARPGGDGWISSGRLDRYARNVDDYMRTKTARPKAMPRNVATVYPRTPTSMLGTMSDFQRLLEAMAAAVVGPPTHALEATSANARSNMKILPAARRKAR